MFTVCLNNVRLSLLIFAFTHHHATHSFVLSKKFSHYDPHVLISSNYSPSSKVGFLGYSKGVLIILHIISSMFDIKVYSIIISKVFGVTIDVNFLFAIIN